MTVPVDRDKLLKLLALIDSDQDAEALAAARRASSLLRHAGLRWEDAVVVGPQRGWRHWLDAWSGYISEARKRQAAESAAEHWHTLARLREDENARLKEAVQSAKAAGDAPIPVLRPAPIPNVTGHDLIDRLLASPDLDAYRRARVEAIATWFKRTNELTVAEQTDLETFMRQLEATG